MRKKYVPATMLFQQHRNIRQFKIKNYTFSLVYLCTILWNKCNWSFLGFYWQPSHLPQSTIASIGENCCHGWRSSRKSSRTSWSAGCYCKSWGIRHSLEKKSGLCDEVYHANIQQDCLCVWLFARNEVWTIRILNRFQEMCCNHVCLFLNETLFFLSEKKF